MFYAWSMKLATLNYISVIYENIYIISSNNSMIPYQKKLIRTDKIRKKKYLLFCFSTKIEWSIDWKTVISDLANFEDQKSFYRL